VRAICCDRSGSWPGRLPRFWRGVTGAADLELVTGEHIYV
jgi:hypothetical protein